MIICIWTAAGSRKYQMDGGKWLLLKLKRSGNDKICFNVDLCDISQRQQTFFDMTYVNYDMFSRKEIS